MRAKLMFFSILLAIGATSRAADTLISGLPVQRILAQLGAKMEAGVSAEQLAEYAGHFDHVDLDGDGKHSKVEYIEKGKYMTPQARRGIFGAADSDGDGFVTKAEYTLNRIITDEGKAIMQAMDDDRDGAIGATEFIRHAAPTLKDEKLAAEIFAAFDTDGDKRTRVPEYLRVWGKWAREGQRPAAERVAAREAEIGKEAAAPKGATEQRRPGGPPSVDKVFERFDGDKDGKLSKAEIPEFASKFILPADANEDGAVTKEELEKYRARGAPRG